MQQSQMDNANDYPKISIITVCFNSVKTIEQTILSVVNQTYQNIEYIIIDGGSEDGTVDIIRRYQEKISYWVSEPDKGIYDAMNKGIDIAEGDYIYFLGSDDILFNVKVVEKVFSQIKKNQTDIYCGKVMLIDYELNLKKEFGKLLRKEEIFHGNMYPHQGMLVKSALLKENIFNTKYKIAADFELLVKLLLENKKIVFYDNVIAFYNICGASSFDKLRYLEYKMILEEYGNQENIKKFSSAIRKSKISSIFQKALNYINCLKLIKKIIGWKEFRGI